MKNTKIDFITQYFNNNYLVVRYKSGVKRTVELGNSYHKLTKTQADFMNRAKKTITETTGLFGEREHFTTWAL